MLHFVSILISLSLSVPQMNGLHNATISKDHPYTIDLSAQTAIIMTDEGIPAYIQANAVEKMKVLKPISAEGLRFLQVIGNAVHFTSNSTNPFQLHFWVLPINFCQGISYSILADRMIGFTFNFPSVPADFCIFSQANAVSFMARSLIMEGDPQSRTEFFDGKLQMSKTCAGNSTCEYSSCAPYLARLTKIKGKPLNAQFQEIVKRGDISSADCKADVVPLTINGPLLLPNGANRISNVVCASAAEHTLRIVISAVNVTFFGALGLFVLNCFRVIDLRSLCGCTKESDRFGEIKQNPYAQSIENPVDHKIAE